MGITIIQKSDLSRPKKKAKIAVVLAGGAVSGAAFKLGGLMALNRLMANRRIIDFDIFVGISAGAILSVFLANGIPTREIISSLEGRRGMLDPIRASDFYYLNYGDFFKKPMHFYRDLFTIVPRGFVDFFLHNNMFRKEFRHSLYDVIQNPDYETCANFIKRCLRWQNAHRTRASFPWNYIPTGIFTTDRFEASIRKNIENNRLHNDFVSLYEKTGKQLYIVAMNLDSACRVIFGHDQVHDVSISKAMQASIAVPFFYKPVEINGIDYIDGAVVKTTSLDIAIDKGADLVICYNPFRPFNHDLFSQNCELGMSDRIRISQDGLYAVFNQVMRTLLHTRLMNNLELRRKNPDFKGDIILVEPSEYDDKFFDMNPLAFWERRKAAKRGYESVRQSICSDYDILKPIFNAYGIEIDPDFIHSASEYADELTREQDTCSKAANVSMLDPAKDSL